MNIHFNSKYQFPDPQFAADDDGVVCIGGDLNTDTLLHAYSKGLFPWFSEGEPIIWWCPDPRSVLVCDDVHVSKSMRSFIKKSHYSVSFDCDFEQVISNCQYVKRKGEPGTWITNDMKNAYIALHEKGFAHSVEVWDKEILIGGLYGVSIGKVFFGESMFSKESNASKLALITLAEDLVSQGIDIIDCQVHNDHLASMGAKEIDRNSFLLLLKEKINHQSIIGKWKNNIAK